MKMDSPNTRDLVLCALSCAVERMTAQEIAENVQMSVDAVRDALRDLEREGLAEYRKEGRSRIWAGGVLELREVADHA